MSTQEPQRRFAVRVAELARRFGHGQESEAAPPTRERRRVEARLAQVGRLTLRLRRATAALHDDVDSLRRHAAPTRDDFWLRS